MFAAFSDVSLNASSPSSSRGHRSNGDPTSSPITENGDDYDNPERWDDFGEDGYKEPHNLDPKFLAREIVAVLLAQKGEAVLSQLGHQFEDMVLSCTYRGIPCRYVLLSTLSAFIFQVQPTKQWSVYFEGSGDKREG